MPRAYECYLCKGKRSINIALHKFPKNKSLCLSWMKACGLIFGIDDVSSLLLCSAHFENKDYISFPGPNMKKRKLRSNAIPTKYMKSKLMLPCTSVMKVLRERTIDSPVSSLICKQSEMSEPLCSSVLPIASEPSVISEPFVEECETSTTPKGRRFYEPRFINEIVIEDFSTPRRAQRTLKMIKERYSQKNKVLQLLHKQTYKLKQKIKNLDDLIKHLNKRKLIDDIAVNDLMVYTNSLLEVIS